VVFVFSGMGAQWWGMGAELHRDEPVFRAAYDEVRALLPPTGRGAFGTPMRDPADAQPAAFALQVALTALLRARGVEPRAVVGHSFGEIAAAWAAGALSLEQAAHIVSVRCRFEQRLAGRGAMLAVSGLRHGAFRGVTVAAVNGAEHVTLSGAPAHIDALAGSLAARGIAARALPVSVAYHSPQLDPLRAGMLSAWGTIDAGEPALPFVSTVGGEGAFDADHWWRTVREPTRFDRALEQLAGHDTFVEIGPHPVLGPLILDAVPGARVVAPIRRGKPVAATLARALSRLPAVLESAAG
jgi:acyl transferase domain-containing protein